MSLEKMYDMSQKFYYEYQIELKNISNNNFS